LIGKSIISKGKLDILQLGDNIPEVPNEVPQADASRYITICFRYLTIYLM